MNSLLQLITKLKLNPVAVMNALQTEAGLVSDNCVNPEDVAGKDCFKACAWVMENQLRLQ